jgi:nitrate reductase NapE component
MSKMEEALVEIITKASQAVETGVSFLSAQLPEVIHQLLVWKAIQSGLLFMVAMLGVVACLAGQWKVHKIAVREEESDLYIIVLALCLPLSIAAIGAFNWLDWLQIIVAPKLYLIEYAAKLVK